MNKYIKTDIEQGLQYLKIGIMNALDSIENGEKKEIILGNYIPFSLIRLCTEERGYSESDNFIINRWDCDCLYYITSPSGKDICIQSNLWYGTSKIRGIEDEND